MSRKRNRIDAATAMSMADDMDLSDGAWGAMVEELSGKDLSECLDEIHTSKQPTAPPADPLLQCDVCKRRFKTTQSKNDHWRDKCGKTVATEAARE